METNGTRLTMRDIATLAGVSITTVSRVANGARELPGILSALESAGIPVASASLSRPTLDDVYLHYTGREFSMEDSGR